MISTIWGRRKTEAQSGWMSWAHAVDACSGFGRLGCRVPAHRPPRTKWPGGLKHTSHTALKWQRKPNRTSNIIISLWQSSAACIVGDPFNSYSPLRCNAYSFFLQSRIPRALHHIRVRVYSAKKKLYGKNENRTQKLWNGIIQAEIFPAACASRRQTQEQ